MEYISSAEQMESLAIALRGHDIIGIDTESNNLHAYQDRICLIQLSTPNGVYIVDPLEMDNVGALANVLENPNVMKIIHGCDYDLRSLDRDYGFRIRNIFDTELSARFLGIDSSNLGNVIDTFLGIKIKKSRSIQKSDWGYRPLSERALEYAAADVLYLHQLYEVIKEKLIAIGRYEWVLEECKMFENIKHIEIDIIEEGYQKLKGVGKLDRKALTVLKQLYKLREEDAKRRNVPAHRIVNNDTLVRMAQNPDLYIEQDLFTENQWINNNRDWIAIVIDKAKSGPLVEKPIKSKSKMKSDEKARKRLKVLREWRTKKAGSLGLQPGIIFPMQGLEAVAMANPDNLSSGFDTYESGIRQWQKEQFFNEVCRAIY
tara:strand:+ start:20479 stop:21597 length:1119 start_codon:yes stop_codon:yes gene_type:complete